MNGSILPFSRSIAVLIGINDYAHITPLQSPIRDVEVLGQMLEKEHGFETLIFQNPTLLELRELIHDTLPTIFGRYSQDNKKTESSNRILFYFAGHGVALESEDNPEGYLVPVDAARNKVDSLLPMRELYEGISGLACDHGLLFLDCCFAGTFRWAFNKRDLMFEAFPNRIYQERFNRYCTDPAWQVICSASYDQFALDLYNGLPLGRRTDKEEDLHSPFALALFEALKGAADIVPVGEKDGIITATELYVYLRSELENKTIEARLRQTPLLFPLPRHDKGEFIFLTSEFKDNLEGVPRHSPYKGLSSFSETDSALFFGREHITRELASHIAQEQFIVLSGASGTGKTSLIQAGVIPLLKEEGFSVLPTLRPGSNPLATLSGVSEQLSNSEEGKPVLLVVDQFEELITRTLDEAERQDFQAELRGMLKDHPSLHLVLGVRSDFEPQFFNDALGDKWKEARFPITPLSPEEIRKVIIQPANQLVYSFEPESLVDQIVSEVSQAPGVLPLLSFTLDELYHAQKDSAEATNVFTEAQYQRLGGVIGALQNRANQVYDSLSELEKGTMKRIMLRMVSLEGGESAGKRAYVEDLFYEDLQENHRVENVLSHLVNSRLIVQSSDVQDKAYIEPAHDALIRSWGKLWEWIKEVGEERIFLSARLNQASKEFLKQGENEDYLWDDNPRLTFLEQDIARSPTWINAQEQAFIRLSITRQMAIRRKNQIIRVSLVGIGILLVLASAFGIWQQRNARIAKRIADSQSIAIETEAASSQYNGISLRILERETLEFMEDGLSIPQSLPLTMSKLFYEQLPLADQSGFVQPIWNIDQLGQAAEKVAILAGKPLHFVSASATGKLQISDRRGNAIGNTQFRDRLNILVGAPDGSYLVVNDYGATPILLSRDGQQLEELEGHGGLVTMVDISPAGDKLVTASQDLSMRLWNKAGKNLRELSRHTAAINDVKFSPDGEWIVSCSDDGSAILWDKEGNYRRLLVHSNTGVTKVAFSPGSQEFATIGWDNILRTWNYSGRLVRKVMLGEGPLSELKYSPDGQLIAVNGLKHLYLIESASGNMIGKLSIPKEWISLFEFSPSGEHLALAGGKYAAIWRSDLSRVVDIAHAKDITYLSFLPNDRYLLTSSHDHTSKVWDMRGRIVKEFALHTAPVLVTDIGANSQFVITGSEDATAKIWNIQGAMVASFENHSASVINATFDPSGKYVVTRSDNARIFAVDGTDTVYLGPHKPNLNSLRLSHAGNQILTTCNDSLVRIYDFKGKLIHQFGGHTGNVLSAEFSPDDKEIVTAGLDGTVMRWTPNGDLLNIVSESGKIKPKDSRPYYGVSYAPDGKRIIAYAADTTARIFQLNGALELEVGGFGNRVVAARFSPDSRYALIASFDGSGGIWDVNKREKVASLQHNAEIRNAYFSPDGEFVLTCSNDSSAILWDLTGEKVLTLGPHIDKVSNGCFSPNGSLIATCTEAGVVKVWNRKGENIALFGRHEGAVESVSFSPDGNFIVSTSRDMTARIWPVPDRILDWLGNEQAPIPRLEER